jgi:DNA-binding protein HU-beta
LPVLLPFVQEANLTTIWHLYLIECIDGSLYTGITIDVDRRFREHISGRGGRYTRSHTPVRLVASRAVGSRSRALRAELAIKRLPREKKILAVRSLEVMSVQSNQRSHTTMNKSELIDAVAKEADLSKAATEKVLAAVIGAVVKAVAGGDTVTLVGFGTFKSSKRAARTGRNPQTGKEIKIAASTVPRFTAGATFKAAVAGKKAAKKK